MSKSTSMVLAGSNSAVVVPFGNHSHRRAKITSTPFRSEWSSAEAAVRPAAAGESTPDRSRPTGIIIDFVAARGSRRAARILEASSGEDQTGLKPMDWAAITYTLMATAFYPALAFLLFRP